MPRFLLACCAFFLFMLEFSPAASAAMNIRVTNASPLEITGILMTGVNREGRDRRLFSDQTLVPGESVVLDFREADSLSRIVVNTGLFVFEFSDCAPFAGQKKPALSLSVDQEGEPWLESGGKRARGNASSYWPRATNDTVPFTSLLEAANLGDIRAMGGKPQGELGINMRIGVSFMDMLWAGMVMPVAGSAAVFTSDSAKIEGISLCTAWNDAAVEKLINGLYRMKLRPWSGEFREGKDMALVKKIRFPVETPDIKAAREAVSQLFTMSLTGREAPASLAIVLVSEDDYRKITEGKGPYGPVFILRRSNAATLELRYHRDSLFHIMNGR
ncbi:hypothetical protein LJC23_03665 [Desulfovibrio sp. OttesenSCG-928-I05]|nr:hypothetical protein [Desulfovibrio sp. OttesenSCG-928-I05]